MAFFFSGFCKEATGQKSSNRSSSDEAAAAAFAERWGVCCLLDPAGGSVLCNAHTHAHMKKKREGTGQWANEAGLQESIPVETGSVSCGP